MKQLTRLAIYSLGWLFTLLSSCTKDQQEPAPAGQNQTISLKPVDTRLLQQLYSEKQYSRQLVQRLAPGAGTTVWTWTPLWEQAIERKRPGSGSYIYVPLELRQTVEPHILKMEGKRRYLRFEQVNNQWLASVRSYFYTLPKGRLQSSITEVSAAKFLSTFTGDVLTQVLETGEVTHSTYRNGKWQPPQSNKPASGAAARASAYCTTFYDCSWYLSCPPPYTYHDVRVIGTTGQDYCEPPYGYTLECGYETQYELQVSYPYQACVDTGDDPGDDPGDNGSGDEYTYDFRPVSPNTPEPDLRSDCNSWQFRAVGPSGYMACGVRNMEVDILFRYNNPDGSFGAGIGIYKGNLYFEMPPRYTPGEAATICANAKDEVEEELEQQYGNSYPPDIAATINTAFYNKMAAKLRPYGGRITRTPNYPNTPVAAYAHSLTGGGNCN